MNIIKEIFLAAKTVFVGLKNIVLLLGKGKIVAAIKEIYSLFKTVYVNNLKGRYITIKGKKIPATAVLIFAVGLYCILPSSREKFNEVKEPEQTVSEPNTYNQDGIKVFDLQKCEDGVCGKMENNSEQYVEEIAVTVTFYAEENIAVCRSQAVASDLAPKNMAEFSVPCEIDFLSYELTNVQVTMAQK